MKPQRAARSSTPADNKRAGRFATPVAHERAGDNTTPEPIAHPPLKWVGGKGQIADAILSRAPSSFTAYHEPFVGGAAVFFALKTSAPVYLSDVNEALIDCYRTIRDELEETLEYLRRLGHPLRAGETWKSRYLAVRKLWNETIHHPAQKAAAFVYMNKTNFRGLWRENKSGGYNVPFGDDESFTPDETNLRACSTALSEANLTVEDFEMAIDSAAAGSWVYCDPPYVGTYSSYSADGFTNDDQVRLAAALQRATSRKVSWTASNSNHPLVKHLYRGHRIEEVKAFHCVAADATKRKTVTELLIRNF